MLTLITLLAFALMALAQTGGYGAPHPVWTTTLQTVTSPPPPSYTTPAPEPPSSHSAFTGKCDYSFCSNGEEWCFYWAGITRYDPSKGAVPGETVTKLGPCTA